MTPPEQPAGHQTLQALASPGKHSSARRWQLGSLPCCPVVWQTGVIFRAARLSKGIDMAFVDVPVIDPRSMWSGVLQSACAAVLSVAGLLALVWTHASVEPISWAAALFMAVAATIAARRWARRVAGVIVVLCVGVGIGQGLWAWTADLWMGLTVGAGAAAAVYGLTRASGRGRWQAGLLAQTALIGVALQLGYRQRAPVDLIHIANADKGLHAVLIGAIAFWANLVLEGRAWRIWRVAVPMAIVVPLALAAVEEWAQGLTPWRHRDELDLLADAIGLGLFWSLSELVRRWPARLTGGG